MIWVPPDPARLDVSYRPVRDAEPLGEAPTTAAIGEFLPDLADICPSQFRAGVPVADWTGTVPSLVGNVVDVGAPLEVFEAVVPSDAVQVPTLHAIRLRTYESLQHQGVDLRALVSDPGEGDVAVAARRWLLSQDSWPVVSAVSDRVRPAGQSTTWHSADTAVAGDFVEVLPADNRKPSLGGFHVC